MLSYTFLTQNQVTSYDETSELPKSFRSRLELLHSSGKILLADAFDVRVREVVNEDFYTQFIYPKQPDDSERYEALVNDVDVQFPPDVERGQIFRIKKTDEVRQGKKIYKVVEAHHIAFTLGQYFLDDYIDFQAAVPLEDALAMIAADTPFTFAIEGNFAPQDIFDWGEKSKLELLHEIRKLYGAELSFDNYTITLTTRKGGNHGAQVRYRHNMKGIERHSHTMERVTRLYGYGKNGLTIEGYKGHTVKYIDSEYFDPNNPFMGKMEWPDIEDQGRLLQEMQKHLKTVELPKVSYSVDFIQMEKVDPEFESERIREAGDTVTVYDDELGYHFDARAIEFERYPFEPKRGHVVLTNFREFKTSDYIFQATVGSKKAIEYTSRNAVLKGVKYDDSVTLVDGLGIKVSDDFNREMVRLGQVGPGEYGLAMYNKDGEKTIWQDAATGDARFAGQLIGGSIAIGSGNNVFRADAQGIWAGHSSWTDAPFYVNMAGKLWAEDAQISGTITASTFTGGFIQGSYINGAVITGGTIQSAGSGIYPRFVLDASTREITFQADATQFVRMGAYFGDNMWPYLMFFNSYGATRFTKIDDYLEILGDVAFVNELMVDYSNLVDSNTGNNFWYYYVFLQSLINGKQDAFTGLNTHAPLGGGLTGIFVNGVLTQVY